MELWMMILFIVIGLVGIMLEPFVPAGGLLAVAGGVLMLVGVGFAFDRSAELGVGFLIACMMLGPLAAIMGFKMLPHTPIGRRLILKNSLTIEAGYQTADKTLEDLERAEGVTITMLRPAGTARFGDRRVDVVADGELIEKNEKVRVMFVEGSRVVVEKIADNA